MTNVGIRARGAWAVGCLLAAACGQGTSAREAADASLEASAAGDASIVTTSSRAPVATTAIAARPNVSMPTPDSGGVLIRDVGAASHEHPSITLARKLLSVDARAADRFAESAHALTLASEGFVSDAWQHPSPTDWSHLGAVLPHRANDFLRVSPVRIERWAMSLAPIGHADVIGQSDAGRVVYEEALPHTDLIATAGDKWMEEVYVLRDSGAPRTLQWKVQLGSALTAMPVVRNELQFLDEHHDAALRIHPPVAYDAKGTKVPTTLAYQDGALTVSVDTAGAIFPIVVDPLVDVPAWTYLGEGSFGGGPAFSPNYGADAIAGSWSTTANSIVMWGGSNGSVFLGDAYTFLSSSYPYSPTPPFSALGLGAVANALNPGVAEMTNGGIVVFGGGVASANTTVGSHQLIQWNGPGNTPFTICTATGGCAVQINSGSLYFNSSGAVQTAPTTNTEFSPPPMIGLTGSYVPSLGSIFFGTDGNTYVFTPYGRGAFGNFMTLQSISDEYHAPPARAFAMMATDTGTGHGLLAGGQATATSTATLHEFLFDMWRFDGTLTNGQSWTPICGAQATPGCPFEARIGGVMAYDATRKKTIISQGYNGYGGSSNTGDTWEYDDTAGTFTQIAANLSPAAALFGLGTCPAVQGGLLGYDRNSQRTILAGGYCLGYTTEVWQLSIRGGGCTANTDCEDGNTCVTEQVPGAGGTTTSVSTCCNVSACPACQTCTSASSPGSCVASQQNLPSQSSNTCPSGGVCDGSGNCLPPLGSSCTGATGCASGNCVNGTCCNVSSCATGFTCADSTGTCQSVLGSACASGTTCASGNCADGVCCSVASCASTTTASGASGPGVCNASGNGTCLLKSGDACKVAADCATGFCVDSVCCNSACTGQCEACDATPGTCTAVAGAVHPNTAALSPSAARAACAGAGTTCGGLCNGTDVSACHDAPTNTSCGAASCTSGVATPVGACSGAGVCNQSPVSCGNYICGATACKTSCAADSDCSSTSLYCSSGQCVPKLTTGATCSATDPTACTSGFCANGVCCNSACTAAGSACNLTGSVGKCLEANGTTCTSGAQCSSGNCVDGVCCNTACTSQCQACDATGNVGTCTTVVGAVHPNASGTPRTACSGSGTCGATCDGKDTTCQYPTASLVCGSASCAAGTATPVGACNGAGACTQPPVSCGNYICGATACKTSCAADSDCSSTSLYCSSGQCVPKLTNGATCSATDPTACTSGFCANGVCCNSACTAAGSACNLTGSVGKCLEANGTTCTSGAQCSSGNCVDGVCCNTACTSQCQACDATGNVGTCTTVVGAVHPNASGTPRTACSGSGTCGATCDGKDTTCQYPSASLVCGTASCAAGTATPVGACNGAGACTQPPVSCGNYICGATACKTSCAADSDCSSTSLYCSSGQCVPKLTNGATCSATDPTACTSGFCANGVCCNSACTAAGSACNLTGSVGKCLEANGTTCTSGAQCSSGNCVDGVCCNTACTSQCQACDATGNVGTCTTVVGAVHPNASGTPRTACSGSGTCGATCDGKDLTCQYPTATAACGSASCTGGVATPVGTCNGAGSCSQSGAPCAPYACSSTTAACNSTCKVDTDCAAGDYCHNSACVPVQPLGGACSGNDACTSGFCVGGVCCNTACTDPSYSCTQPTSLGTCSKPNGKSCSLNTDCASGFCVDGVCCNSACTGECQACDVSTATTNYVGTCTPVVGKPHGARTACASGGAAGCGLTCDGVHWAACTYPSPTTACGTNACTDSATQDSSYTQSGTCDGSGNCSAKTIDCGAYVCAAGSGPCKTTCATNSDCSSGNFCKTGTCVPLTGLGDPCSGPAECSASQCVDGVCCATTSTSCGAGASCDATPSTAGHCKTLQGNVCSNNGDCASGFCVDGVCCDQACQGSCQACAEPGSIGSCVPVVGAPRLPTGSTRQGCAALTFSPDPGCGTSCDGTNTTACQFATTTATCGTPACTSGIETLLSTCDGGGHCTPNTKPCAPYSCGATACNTSCVMDTDCASGDYCSAGTCVPTLALGTACTSPDQCASGTFCTDGVCCSVASCGTGAACTAAGPSAGTNVGQCLKQNGVMCASPAECATGVCADGVCCNTACDGQCEACDVSASPGVCTPVTGNPHGSRTACDTKSASDCAKATCDGSTRTSCGGFANSGTTPCGTASCTMSGELQSTGFCDGQGACTLPAPSTCVPYVCAPTTGACGTSCAADTDCATGYKCDANVCVQGATCSADQTSSTAKDGTVTNCAPYLCGGDGTCSNKCATSANCQQPAVCDQTIGACIETTTSSSGGCAVARDAGRDTKRSGAVTALVTLAALALQRRRKRA